MARDRPAFILVEADERVFRNFPDAPNDRHYRPQGDPGNLS
jgi:hypothetical protein